MTPPAVVLLSGGLDSATALAVATSQGFQPAVLTIDYGQRHRCELECANQLVQRSGIKDHLTVSIDLRSIGGSALTSNIEVPKHADHSSSGTIPVTYVPARNLIFLSLAAAYAETLHARDLFIGVNAVDYSGYPDCRPEFIESFQRTVNLGTKSGVEGGAFKVHTPLIRMTKAQIISLGTRLRVDYALTTSCYDPDERGNACGRCDSCTIRKRGFEEAGVPDPRTSALQADCPGTSALRAECLGRSALRADSISGRTLVQSDAQPGPLASDFAEQHGHSGIESARRADLPSLPTSETFTSIQGEGSLTGVPSFFIRVSGCNLRCTWCDTPYASWNPEGDRQSLESLAAAARSSGVRHVVLTGGEPLMFEQSTPLTHMLRHAGLHITIETAGTIFREVACDLMSISPKLRNSTPSAADPRDPSGAWHDRHEARRLNIPILQQLIDAHPNRQLKFVVAAPADLPEVEALLSQLRNVLPHQVMLMPEGLTPPPAAQRSWISQACLVRNWRYCHRLHIDLFGNTRGT